MKDHTDALWKENVILYLDYNNYHTETSSEAAATI